MTVGTLGQLLDRLLEEKEGSEGFWHGQREGVTVYVVADDAWHDVMMSSSSTYAPLTQTLREGVEQVGGAGSGAGARLALSVAFLEFVTEEMQQLSERWDRRRAELGH